MPESEPLAADDLVRAALAIGLELERHALTDGRQAVNWIGLKYLEGADRYQLDVLNESLYDGCSGVALFLAALARITGERRFADLSLRSLHSLRTVLRETDPRSRRVAARLRGIGGAVGIGSMIYALVRTAGLLEGGDAGLLEDATALGEWLTPEVISDDERLDVMTGAAGALLGMLALYSVTGRQSALQTAIVCGEHLLKHRVTSRSHRAWQTVGDRPLTGFSHGAAGISYALTRLYAATGERTYLEAAAEGIEYERTLFSERHGNWADLRPAGAARVNRFPVKWCHGAAGIALARLGCRHFAQVPGLERDIEAGLRTTRAHFLQDADFLCCGNLGRAELFLTAGRFAADPEWERLAAIGTASVVKRAGESGDYRLFNREAGLYNPAFFHGTAGIGYQLLRLTSDELPSVLLLL
jgi:type 2 lantibiotic biosynthesis protein LanM